MENKNSVAVGIVLFNPEVERLIKCIESVKDQVSKVYIFDNSITTNCIKDDNIVYITENKNKGVAYALNRIMERAHKDGFEWVVTMDQDSIAPCGMIEDFKKNIKKHTDIGIFCPQVIDRRRVYLEVENDIKESYVDFCITSASCTSIDAWEKCGKFDEWMFVDLVDNDFCKRIILNGYRILKLNKWILDQEFGKIIPKSYRTQKFWMKISEILSNQNFAKLSYKKFVSPLRVYYTNRNIIYINKKFKKYGTVGYENYNCNGYLGFIIAFILPSILRAQDKKEVIKATIHGIVDGIKSKPEQWSVRSGEKYAKNIDC